MKCVRNVPRRSIRTEEGLIKYTLFEVTTFRIIKKIRVNVYIGKAHNTIPGSEKHKPPVQMNATDLFTQRPSAILLTDGLTALLSSVFCATKNCQG